MSSYDDMTQKYEQVANTIAIQLQWSISYTFSLSWRFIFSKM